MKKPLHVFCCYAREDRLSLLTLKKHLRSIQHDGLIIIQADIDISPGENWEQKISHYLDTAQIILLLISSDFMDSDYCYSKEMMRAMERHECREARVVPIILRPTLWKGAPFEKLQILPTNAEPIASNFWHTPDDAFVDVAKGIQTVVNELTEEPTFLQISADFEKTLDSSTISDNSTNELTCQTLNEISKLNSSIGDRLKRPAEEPVRNIQISAPIKEIRISHEKRGVTLEKRKRRSQAIKDFSEQAGVSVSFIHIFFFCVVSGVGTTVGLVTQLWILGLTSAIVASFLAVAVYYKAMNWLTITVLVLVGVAITFGLTRYASSLLYDQPQVGHFWFFGEQTFWIGRQVDAGVIAGIICGGAAIQRPLWHKEETLFLSMITLAVPFWIIILSLIGYFFNGGFGFGPGWFFLIIGIITSYYSISGLIISLFVFHASNYI